MEMMRAVDYAFTYRGKESPALRDVRFSASDGEVILVAGDSGSGKSTFLKSLNGLIPEIAEGRLDGSRLLKSEDMDKLPIYEISRSVGSVFQNPRSQFFTLHATSELVFAMENYGLPRQEMESRIGELKAVLPIAPLLDRKIAQLSSGERQLLALASAMTLHPDVLLFDEPSANLDYSNAMRLKEIMRTLKEQGKTILVADHRFFYLSGLVDRVFLIEDGTLRVFESEESFRASGYNTRSFDLFGMDVPFHLHQPRGDPVIQVDGISKWDALQDVSLSLYGREITAIVGVNGAGKTTLARLLTRALKPDRGCIHGEGLPFCVMQDADFQLFGTCVESELDIGHKGLAQENKQAVLEQLGLWGLRDTHPFDLSGGEKQRLQIAVAALSDAKLVIFDEPTSGLDAKSMERVVREVEKLAREKAVLVISHDYEFIRRVADRVLYLKDGRLQQDFMLGPETVGVLDQIFVDMEAGSG